jgi:hypothetical protein
LEGTGPLAHCLSGMRVTTFSQTAPETTAIEQVRGEQREVALRRMQEHLVKAADGSLILDPMVDAQTLGIDPIVFSDLKRLLEHTNALIQRGEIESLEAELV